jgi:hypothetical protein
LGLFVFVSGSFVASELLASGGHIVGPRECGSASVFAAAALHARVERQGSRFKCVEFSIGQAAGKTRAHCVGQVFSRRGEQNVLHRGAKIEFVRIANVKAAKAAFPSRAFAQISRPRYDVARHIRRTDVTL